MATDKDITILAVGNDPKFLEALVQILEIEGYKSSGIVESHVAVNRIRETLPDLIICDIDMSLVDDISSVNELRNNPNQAVARIPIIFLTDSDPMGEVIRELEEGIDDYIIKPAGIVELRERINGALGQQKRLFDPTQICE